jgi:hypothetical protein
MYRKNKKKMQRAKGEDLVGKPNWENHAHGNQPSAAVSQTYVVQSWRRDISPHLLTAAVAEEARNRDWG